jgi:hypothetical protein
MTDVDVVKTIIEIFGTIAAVAIIGTLIFLRYVREKVRSHRHVRRMVTEATAPHLPFEQPMR